jgi:hypothetical protein
MAFISNSTAINDDLFLRPRRRRDQHAGRGRVHPPTPPWVRLDEKGGKQHEMSCDHNLEAYLHEWLETSGLRAELKAPLFPTVAAGAGRGKHRLTRRAIAPRAGRRHRRRK